MSIVGIIDPSHNEKKADIGGRAPKWFPLDTVLLESLNGDPRWSSWDYELLAAAIGELQDRGSHISTTALTGPCPRSTVLERKEPYVASIDDLWRAFRGTMIHYVLEYTARPGSIAEARFFATLDGRHEISCSPDLVWGDTIKDYKNTKEVPRYDFMYKGHQLQLQFNRWIVNNATRWEKDGQPFDLPFDVRTAQFEHLVCQYLDIDGPKAIETTKTVQVPTKTPGAKATKNQRVPAVWSDKAVMDELVPRYRAMRAALDSYPVWPEGIEELWGGPPGWRCPGYPYCPLPKCLAKRYTKDKGGLVW